MGHCLRCGWHVRGCLPCCVATKIVHAALLRKGDPSRDLLLSVVAAIFRAAGKKGMGSYDGETFMQHIYRIHNIDSKLSLGR